MQAAKLAAVKAGSLKHKRPVCVMLVAGQVVGVEILDDRPAHLRDLNLKGG